MSSIDMCEHDWPGSGCKECFPEPITKEVGMSPEQYKFLDELRNEGYCVIVWTPEEIGVADESHLEDIATSRGNDYLASFNTEDVD